MKYNFPILALLCVFFCSCHSNSTSQPDTSNDTTHAQNKNSTADYDLSRPSRTWELPPDLKEISGNTWVDNNHLLVIEDLHPNLYLIKFGDKAEIEKTIPFEASEDKKVDIEDVTMVNHIVYALWSHGVVFKITDWLNKEQTKEIPTTLDKKNNTEGICYDPVSGSLLIACKNQSAVEDEKKSTRAVYKFDLNSEKLDDQPFMLIQKKDFKDATGNKLDFYPSAIAVHPITHDIYVLSTKENKCMARYSHDGQFISVQFIDKDTMPQPEGICFSPDGTMYISTEGKHGAPPKLFEYRAGNKE